MRVHQALDDLCLVGRQPLQWHSLSISPLLALRLPQVYAWQGESQSSNS